MKRNTIGLSIAVVVFSIGTLLSFGRTSISAQQAAPSYVGRGTLTCSTGTIVPSLPSGIAINDVLLLFVETGNQAIAVSNANGGIWSQTPHSPQGTSSAGTRLTAFWSRYNGTQGAPTMTDSGNHQCGIILAFRGAETQGTPFDTTSGGVNATGPVSLSVPGSVTTGDSRLVVVAVADDWDNASVQRYANWTNADLSGITEQFDGGGTQGNGGGLGIVTAQKNAAGSFGATTVSQNTAIGRNGFITLAIKPIQPVQNTFAQVGYRIRADDSQPLNADAGWTSFVNTEGFVFADSEFRVRFEIESTGSGVSQGFELWYSRDGAPYELVPTNLSPWSASSLYGQKSVQAVPSGQYNEMDSTADILASSSYAFVPGFGMESNTSGAISFTNPSQTELEWTIVPRKLFDGKGHNPDGTTFDFRLYKTGGAPLDGYINTARVTIKNRSGHIGGTPVETPMRYHVTDGNGNLYYLTEYADTGNTAVMMKSQDGGISWNPVDVGGAPIGGDLEGSDMELRDNTIYIAVQGPGSGDAVQHWQFAVSTHPTTPDRWVLVDEVIASPSPDQQCAAITRRASDTVVAYCGNPSGNDERLYYRIKTDFWGSEQVLDASLGVDFGTVGLVRDSSESAHFVYVGHDGSSYKLYTRSLPADNTLSVVRIVADTGITSQSLANRANMTPPISWVEGQTEKIGVSYRKSDNKLYFRSWNADGSVFDSEQLVSDGAIEWQEGGNNLPVADVVVDDSLDTIYGVYAQRTTMDLYSDFRSGGTWGVDTLINGEATAHWVRSSVFVHAIANGGAKVLGTIWDNGSGGGTGRTRYDQIQL